MKSIALSEGSSLPVGMKETLPERTDGPLFTAAKECPPSPAFVVMGEGKSKWQKQNEAFMI